MAVTSTSPSLAAYLKAMAAAPETEDGSVLIEPELAYGFGEFSLKLALRGPRGRYVVPSIGAFAQAVRAVEAATYGPKLSFVHRAAAFAPASRPLLRFIERIAQARGREGAASGAPDGLRGRGASRVGRAASGGALGRSVDLTEAEAVDFLDAMDGLSFAFRCTDGSVRASQTVSVQAGDPPAVLRLVEDGEGFTLVRDDALIGAAAGGASYVLYDGVFYRTTEAFSDGADFLREVYRSDDRELHLAADDAAAFGAHVLPRLERAFEVSVPPALAAYRRRPCKLAFFFDKVADAVEVACCARYGESEVVLAVARSAVPAALDRVREGTVVVSGIAAAPPEGEGPDAVALPVRDLAREQAALELLRAYFPPTGVVELADEEAAGRLLFEGLARFQALGEVHTTAAFDRLLFGRAPRLQVGLSLAGDLIAMDVAVADVPKEELAALLESYRRHRRFHRLRQGAFVNVEEAEMGPLRRLMEDMGVSEADLAAGRVELPTWQAFYLANELADAYREDGFARFVDQYRALHASVQAEGAEGAAAGRWEGALSDVLRPYQAAGARWIGALWAYGFGGILADEMGLGKTLQVIAALAERYAQGAPDLPSLILCPASLIYNWKAEFDRFAPKLPVAVVAGTPAERRALREAASCGAEDPPPILITSYDLLRQDAREWEEADLDVVVIDEAHYIKNHATRTTRAVKRLRARRRLALTGTPMENRLSELWSLFDFLMPGLLGPYQRFRERFDAAILGGDEEAARRLRALVAPFILRRTKEQVAPELPEKTVSRVLVALEGEQRRLYDGAEQSLRERLAAQIRLSRSRGAKHMSDKEREAAAPRVQVLAELTALRRIALDPALVFENYKGASAKMEALLDVVAHGVGSGQKMLVYSQFTSFLTRVAARLGEEGVAFFELTGATPAAERLDLAEAFNGGEVPVFLISLKAGGVGLNLTGATCVVHTDPWWNAAAARQAADRAHRIGQSRPVTIYELVAADTIEERMVELARMKDELAALILDAEGSGEGEGGPQAASGAAAGVASGACCDPFESARSLTPEELYDLLGG
ncbi:SNF2-related protein [Adlercreutzia sp. R25]|uniref:DEAD/DEAH box helicase n=1 Tax=Adlercreutzia shanghongiae TaxID=3111773 RepID=UPI002DB6E743|nr:SNF2-related protein [Adlercreutzia sp. R25]MEC4273860.1 SNF2-related protein [Adlercreutzia sp. R25]